MEINLKNLIVAYKEATESEKRMLANLFGKENCQPKLITDRVKTYEDACDVLGIQQHNFLCSEDDPHGDNASVVAFQKLTTIVRALNEGWQPDWSNSGQYKYYPWFKANVSGSGLSFDGYDVWYSNTDVGSRLAFKNSELAAYAGKQFNDLYNQFLTIK